MSSINCPVCGSTAQVELVWEDRSNYSKRRYNEYQCGCGCRFEAMFELKKINVIAVKDKNNA